nr:procathepsin L - guinea pig (fragments) [Cavia porcellus]
LPKLDQTLDAQLPKSVDTWE